jgi:hypothetical protein
VAGDWIKLRTELQDDPEVMRLSAMLKLDRFSVMGRLAVLWGWADKHTTDGRAPVTLELLDDLISFKGFSDAMVVVGWLEVDDKGIRFPKFARHNGESAKKRALTARRVQRHKQRKDNAALTQAALPREEKRRDKNNKADEPSGVWKEGLDLLLASGLSEREARSFVGMCLRDWEEADVRECLFASVGKADPSAYCRKLLKDKPRKRKLATAAADVLSGLREKYGEAVRPTSDGKGFWHEATGQRFTLAGERIVG